MKNFANVLLLLALAGCHGKQRALRTIPVKESVKSVKQQENSSKSLVNASPDRIEQVSNVSKPEEKGKIPLLRKKDASGRASNEARTILKTSSQEVISYIPTSEIHEKRPSEQNEGPKKDYSAKNTTQAVNIDLPIEPEEKKGISEDKGEKIPVLNKTEVENAINTPLPKAEFQSDELSQGSKEDELDNESTENYSEQENILTEHTVVSKSDSPRTVDVDGVQSKAYSKLTPVAIERFPSNREHEDNLSITHKPPDETDEELLSQHSQTSYTTETQSFKMDPKTPSETPQSFLSSYSVDTIPVPQIKPNASTLPLSLPIITKLSDKLLLKNIRPFSENHTVHLHDVEVSSSTQEPNPENQCGDPNTESQEVEAGDKNSEAAVTNTDEGKLAIK